MKRIIYIQNKIIISPTYMSRRPRRVHVPVMPLTDHADDDDPEEGGWRCTTCTTTCTTCSPQT